MTPGDRPTPLRILTLADTPPDPNAGASGSDLQTVRGLRALGHHVVDLWRDALPHRIRHGNLHYAMELPRGYRAAVHEQLRREAFDVVLVSQPHGYLAARWIRRHAPGTVFVSRSHGWEAHVEAVLAPFRRRWGVRRWGFPRALLGWPLSRWLATHCGRTARACHGIVVSASLDKDYIVQRHGVEPERVACIAHAPPDSFLRSPAPGPEGREPGSVLLVGQSEFVKGVDVIIEVIRACDREALPLRFTWVVADAHHARLRERFGEAASRRVALRPAMSQEDLRATYDAHAIFLFPSLFEGFGKAFLEAMSRGLCVVASDVGGMHDVITPDVDGLLCPPGDVEGVLRHLRALVRSPDRAAQLGAAARPTAERYSWRRSTLEAETFFRALLSRERVQHPPPA